MFYGHYDVYRYRVEFLKKNDVVSLLSELTARFKACILLTKIK